MTTDPKSTRKDLQKTTAAALGEKVPGVATAMAAIDVFRRRKWEKRFEVFMAQLMVFLDKKNPLSLQFWIEEHGEEDWMVDGFERGFRLLMETMDEVAKKCALVMIAHYLNKATAPDRVYRKFGDFFQQADYRVLEMTERLSEAAVQIQMGDAHTFCLTVIKHNQTQHVSYTLITAGVGRARALTVEGIRDQNLLRDTCDVLIRSGLLSTHASPLDNTGEIPWGKAEIHQINLWRMLHIFLAPIREISQAHSGSTY